MTELGDDNRSNNANEVTCAAATEKIRGFNRSPRGVIEEDVGIYQHGLTRRDSGQAH
jgi:hypothetical protein